MNEIEVLERAEKALLRAAETIRDLRDWQQRAVYWLRFVPGEMLLPGDERLSDLLREAEEKP